MSETPKDLIEEAKAKGWDYECFESYDDTIVVQLWPHAMTMYEYVFSGDEHIALQGWLHVMGCDKPTRLF